MSVPHPQGFGTTDVMHYVVGAVLHQILERISGGECVYTRKQHAAVCDRFGCTEMGATSFFVRGTLKFVIERMTRLMPGQGQVKCDVVEDSQIDLLHITWTPGPAHLQSIGDISSGGSVKVTQTALNRND